MRITMRGDVLDGRNLLKAAISGPSTPVKARQRPRDLDLDVKLGAIAGHNGEAARQVELRVTRRNGEMRGFLLRGRVGAEGSISGDLRVREGTRTAVVLYGTDAGALLRFVDLYARMSGGDIWMYVDPPSPDGLGSQEGVLNIREFTIRDPAIDRLMAAAPADPNLPGPRRAGVPVQFTKMRVEFERAPTKMVLRDGVIWGPAIGATIEGQIDHARNDALLRGTYVPAYGLNNLFARLPVVGLFMGGPQEGLFGVTYEIAGPLASPTLRINPISAVAPGFLRKLFEFRGTPDTAPADVVTR
jgi:hypothetical protein